MISAIKEAECLVVGLGDEWKDATLEDYQNLKKLVAGKNYFIVTMCTDGKIYDSVIDGMHFVDPCGSVRRLQCPDGCDDYIVDVNDGIKSCPHCGKELIPNVVGCSSYVEAGYMKKWKLYSTWLSFSFNQKLVALELGVSFKYPSVIRFPFERMVMFNQKGTLIRVQETFPQVPTELKEKGISIKENSLEWVKSYIEQEG